MVNNILDVIIENKEQEVKKAKGLVSLEELKSTVQFSRTTLSLKSFLLDEAKTGIIAEFKRKSPSKGVFNSMAEPEQVTRAYAQGGASGLSVLTDEMFFGGTSADLEKARKNEIPILRKDFIIDEYQICESKAIGADVILLIAACLTGSRVRELASYAKSLGLEVLLEIHDETELSHICAGVDIVGVNNRDLKSFTVDVNRSIVLASHIPGDKLKISESGISDISTIKLLKEHGYNGFLIGETFMKEKDPAIAYARFVNELKQGEL
ncbi:MAG: indole-3-glycerol phosphate synthase TrpC [Chitinophagaceae bacterium]